MCTAQMSFNLNDTRLTANSCRDFVVQSKVVANVSYFERAKKTKEKSIREQRFAFWHWSSIIDCNVNSFNEKYNFLMFLHFGVFETVNCHSLKENRLNACVIWSVRQEILMRKSPFEMHSIEYSCVVRHATKLHFYWFISKYFRNDWINVISNFKVSLINDDKSYIFHMKRFHFASRAYEMRMEPRLSKSHNIVGHSVALKLKLQRKQEKMLCTVIKLKWIA